MFIIFVTAFLESLTGDDKNYLYVYESIFIWKAELISQKPPWEDSSNVLKEGE